MRKHCRKVWCPKIVGTIPKILQKGVYSQDSEDFTNNCRAISHLKHAQSRDNLKRDSFKTTKIKVALFRGRKYKRGETLWGLKEGFYGACCNGVGGWCVCPVRRMDGWMDGWVLCLRRERRTG